MIRQSTTFRQITNQDRDRMKAIVREVRAKVFGVQGELRLDGKENSRDIPPACTGSIRER